jgi:hypothetical protein
MFWKKNIDLDSQQVEQQIEKSEQQTLNELAQKDFDEETFSHFVNLSNSELGGVWPAFCDWQRKYVWDNFKLILSRYHYSEKHQWSKEKLLSAFMGVYFDYAREFEESKIRRGKRRYESFYKEKECEYMASVSFDQVIPLLALKKEYGEEWFWKHLFKDYKPFDVKDWCND